MNWKKAVTIGLLTITAIGLVGCAVILSKNNPNAIPKVQTNAYYEITNINNIDDEYYYTITGNINENNTTINYIDEQTDVAYIYGNYRYSYNIDNLINTRKILQLQFQPTYIYLYRWNTDTIDTFEYEITEEYTTIQTIYFDSTKTIKSIDLMQDRLIYENSSNCFYTLATKIYFTDNTNQTFTGQTIYIDSENIVDEYEIEFGYTHRETTDHIPINNTINTIETYITTSNPYQTGYTTGYNAGEDYGYDTGYAAGYQAKGDLADGNFLSLRNTMLSVLTMPFTFINQAFNVTLWEGTPYAFNISNFIKGMIAIAAILFIIRLFTSGFSIIGNYTGGITNSRLDRQQKRANIAKTKAQTANIGKPKEIHSTSEHTNTSHIYTHKDK